MQLREYLSVVRKRWIPVAILVVVGGGLSAAASLTATPLYQSTSSVYFSLPFANSANDLSQGSNYTQNQMQSYATLATLPEVLSPVIEKLNLDESPDSLSSAVKAAASNDTVIIEIAATDPSPQKAADIANAVAEQLGVAVKSLAPKGANGEAAISASTVAPATAASSPSSPNTKRNVALGLFGGLVAGLLLAIAIEALDTSIRTAQQLRKLSNSPVLGVIPFDDKAKTSPLILEGSGGRSVRAEAVRQLRTNLQFVDVEVPARVVVVTSALGDEGKSTTAVNLAVSFANSGSRVVLIEADLRRPRVSDYLGLERAVGLTNVLAGRVDLDEVLQPFGRGGLSVLPSGSIPPNPSELLGGGAMRSLLTELKRRFDMIIVDTPPLLPVTDAAVASKLSDGAVVVVRAGKTTRHQLLTALQALDDVDARVLGTVLNRAPRKGADAHSHYGYGYVDDDSNDATRLPDGAGLGLSADGLLASGDRSPRELAGGASGQHARRSSNRRPRLGPTSGQ